MNILRTIKHTLLAQAYRCAAGILCRVGTRARRSTERQLLVVCSAFPPNVGGGVYRPLSWIRTAEEFAWRVTVATQSSDVVRSRAGKELLMRVPEDASVLRLPRIWIKPGRTFFPSTDGDLAMAFYHALVTIRRMKRAPPTLVLVSGPEFDNFTLARLVARYFRVPLVLDYRDEWSDSPFDFVRHGRDDRLYERRALDAARLAVFTTRSQLEANRLSFGATPERIVIPNGWDDDLFSPSDAPDTGDPRRSTITIRYTGNLGAHVDPAAFLSALAGASRQRPDLIDRVRIHITGSVPETVRRMLTELKLESLVSVDDAIPQSEVPRLLRQSDALLILYPRIMARYIPGKLYEYLATGRPILVIGDEGEVPDLVRTLRAGLVASGASPQALIEMVERLLDCAPHTFQTPERRRWVERHSRSEAARTLLRKLDGIAAECRIPGNGHTLSM